MMTRQSITGPFGLSVAALALAALFLLFTLPSLIGAVFTSGTGAARPAEAVDKLMAKHDEGMKTYQTRLNGRSPFFKPPPKYVAPPPLPPKPKDEEPPPPPPPVAPVTYGGPSLTAIFGDEAWFKAPTTTDKPFTLKVGETEPKSGVKLLSSDAPWSVRVAHKGGEYTVGFTSAMFDRTKSDMFFKPSPKMSLPIPGLIIMPLPTASTTGSNETAETPKAAAEESDDDEKDAPAESPPGRLRARPLDGSPIPPATDPDEEKARNETGDTTDEEEGKPAESQPENGRRPPAPPQNVSLQPAKSGTAHQASPTGPK